LVTFDESSRAGLKGGNVQLQDNNNNYLISGGDTVEAELFPLSKLQVKARDNKNGTYDLIYPSNFVGKYEVTIKINDKPARGGPWTVEVVEEPLTQEIRQEISKIQPKSQEVWVRLLSKATPSERTLVMRELRALVSGKTLTPSEVSDLLPYEAPTATLL